MKRIFIICAALVVALAAQAQILNTNGTFVNEPATYSGSLGQSVVLNQSLLAPATTNQYDPSYNFTNSTSPTVFIGTSDFDSIGLSIQDVQGTNGAALAQTDTITVRIKKSMDGVTAENVPTWVLTVTSGVNNAAAYTNLAGAYPGETDTNLDVHGCAGLFVTTVEGTNASGTATNYVTVRTMAKGAKVQAIPATYRN